jgi:hypothetical protein
LKKFTFIIASLFIFTGCNKQPEVPLKPVIPPPLKAGQILDPNSDYAKYWTGMPGWINFDDKMLLKITQQFGVFWTQDAANSGMYSIKRPKSIVLAQELAFSLFLPDFEGYTPDNYKSEFDENEIKILSIDSAPMSYAESGAAGSYPPNAFKRISDGLVDTTKYTEKYGLRCYSFTKNIPEGSGYSEFCYGLRDAKLGEYILLDVFVPPYPDWMRNPFMRTTYFTKQYGGLEISWRTNAKNFSRWQEIDQQIWQHLEEWNLTKQ